MAYVGRFAPSPTGPLHAGSLTTALASWLDARAHGGRWLVRLEDVDTPRTIAGAGELILAQLTAHGLEPDERVQWQSKRTASYQDALSRLLSANLVYGCACSRQVILQALAAQNTPPDRHTTARYPGTCRDRALNAARTRLAQRLNTKGAEAIEWQDRRAGSQTEDVHGTVGDFVLRRADGVWAYQLAVVVDDAEQGVTHVVRGADLSDNTARQIFLQRCLGLPTPVYLHTPLVMGADGQKLSKQNGAESLPTVDPIAGLRRAAASLGLPADVMPQVTTPHPLLTRWIEAWKVRWIDP